MRDINTGTLAAGTPIPSQGATDRWLARLPTTLRYPRWNLSRHASVFRHADAFVVSVQKSGRTWVRVLLTAYLAERAKAAPSLATPRVVYSHDLWEQTAKQRLGERLRGKWLIPGHLALSRPLLLVARDPRDVMVSLYFHLQKRSGTFSGDLSALLRDRTFGVARVVAVMNRWLREWSRHPRLHLLRYEDARRSPEAEFGRALEVLLAGEVVNQNALRLALEIASFDNMRRLEAGDIAAEGAALVSDLNREALRPKDAKDPDSFKVRRGKVGGYLDYLGAADIDYLNAAVEKLDPRYGYGARASRPQPGAESR